MFVHLLILVPLAAPVAVHCVHLAADSGASNRATDGPTRGQVDRIPRLDSNCYAELALCSSLAALRLADGSVALLSHVNIQRQRSLL